jgi:hypothetical protein
MSSRPSTVTTAAILLFLLSLSNLPWPWMMLFPGAEEAPEWVIYSGTVLAIAGAILSYGLWQLAGWSYWASVVVCVLNILLGLPGLFEAPGTAIKIAIAFTIVVAAVIIALLLKRETKRALAGPGSASPA